MLSCAKTWKRLNFNVIVSIGILLIAYFVIGCNDYDQEREKAIARQKIVSDSLRTDSLNTITKIKRQKEIEDSVENERLTFTSKNSEVFYFNEIIACGNFPNYNAGPTLNEEAIISVKKKEHLINIRVGDKEKTYIINDSFKDLNIGTIFENSSFYSRKLFATLCTFESSVLPF